MSRVAFLLFALSACDTSAQGAAKPPASGVQVAVDPSSVNLLPSATLRLDPALFEDGKIKPPRIDPLPTTPPPPGSAR
ncbi:MAG: hypothetical protein HOV80_20040 [Polyangiaceae bacterium]|nr:hypothetical protein [Polyangiaceae bacterium]